MNDLNVGDQRGGRCHEHGGGRRIGGELQRKCSVEHVTRRVESVQCHRTCAEQCHQLTRVIHWSARGVRRRNSRLSKSGMRDKFGLDPNRVVTCSVNTKFGQGIQWRVKTAVSTKITC